MIRRPRIEGWFARNANVPLRLVCAPAGSGKTTALAQHLLQSSGRAAYLQLGDGEAPAEFRGKLAQALSLQGPSRSYPELLDALRTCAPCEISIDDFDRAGPELLAELTALIGDAPTGVSLIYLGRARDAIDVERFLAVGIAVALDAGRLAFSADEMVGLAESLGIACATPEVGRLLEETEGWAIVVSGAIRAAAENGNSLAGAYERWRRGNGRHFAGFIKSELRHLSRTDKERFGLALKSDGTTSATLAEFEARGLFVRYDDGVYRPYRVAQQFAAEVLPAAAAKDARQSPLLVVRMFGRFDATIEGTPIAWIRRRDQQLFKYLLLKPDGTAARAELREIFWPEADAHLATQSVRTACSNVRKAIAALVGYDRVDRYFYAHGNDVVVNLGNAVLDVRRFSAHALDGDAELERNNIEGAIAHYVAAEALYNGELLSGDYPEPWYLPRAEMYKAVYIGILERLADLHVDSGDDRRAREYADRVLSLAPTNDRMRRVATSAVAQIYSPFSAGWPAVDRQLRPTAS